MPPKRLMSESPEPEFFTIPSTSSTTNTSGLPRAKPNEPKKRVRKSTAKAKEGEGQSASGSVEKGGKKQEEEEEKRQAMFKRAIPKNIQERVDRVLTQRFFCVERNKLSPTSEAFKVLGSTGNVYTVTIQHLPSCTCPDGIKGNHCKHILFVQLKILKVPMNSNLHYQKALLTSELEAIFTNAPSSPSDSASARIEAAYRAATREEGGDSVDVEEKEVEGGVGKRLPEEGDSCPVCYEDFEQIGSATGLVFCLSLQGCGKAVHKVCFDQWARQAQPGQPVTCVFCRAEWAMPTPAGGSGSGAGVSYSREGYLNLGGSLGISQYRDDSSYYHGPKRGQAYHGYHNYY